MSNPGGTLPGLSGSLRTMAHFQYEAVGLDAFYGGMSVDRKIGTKAPQFYFGRHIDFRKNPSQFTILPQGQPEASGVVSDLVLDMCQLNTGQRFAIGDSGKLYSITSGLWENVGSIKENSGGGIIYRADVDHIYIPGQTAISRLKQAQQSPNYQAGWFQNGRSSSATCYKTDGSKTYAPLTTLKENTTELRKFTADIEPLYQIGINIISKGTGDWTLTLHNDANDVLGAVTVTNANIKNNTVLYFVFSSPIRIQRGDNGAGSALTYHFHVTSTVNDGKLATGTPNSLQDCNMELWANALVSTQNGLHPTINFLQYTLIGNGNYVAQYEPLQDSPQMNIDYLPHRLTFPPGYEVCGFAQKNLLCVIGAEKRSSSGEFQEGALFFWDGVSDTYNDWWPVPEGSPESLFSSENQVFFMAGGALYTIQGVDQPVKIRTFRNTDSEFSSVTDSTHCYPNMMAIRRGILLMGYPSYTTNQSLEHAIFSFGQTAKDYPVSFGESYTISTGTLTNNGSNNLKLGMIKSFGDTLYTSWRDDSAAPHKYGVDIVDNTSAPASNATIESLLFDGGRPQYYKKAGWLLAVTDPLPSDCSYVLKYKLDREANWHYSTGIDATLKGGSGSTHLVFPINKRYLTVEFGMDLTVGTTTPVIRGLFLFTDLQILEKPIGGGV